MKPLTLLWDGQDGRKSYDDLRPSLQTGDIVCTAHRSAFGRMIHVGQGFKRPWHSMIICRPGERVEIMESTAAEAGGKGKRGVQRHYLSERIDQTNGEVWVSRLSEDLRRYLDIEKMEHWMLARAEEGADYSYGQALWAGLDGLIRILPENTWSKTYMCSRFAMAALRHGFRDQHLAGYYIAKEASPTPAQLVRMRGWYAKHYQLKGLKLIEIG